MTAKYYDERVTGHLEHKESGTHFYIVQTQGIFGDCYAGYAIVPGRNFAVRIDRISSERLTRGDWLGRQPMAPDKEFYARPWHEVKEKHFPRK